MQRATLADAGVPTARANPSTAAAAVATLTAAVAFATVLATAPTGTTFTAWCANPVLSE